jgi:hypothetical protein
MTTLQIKKLRMYMALRVLLRVNPAILEKLPNAKELLTALDAAIADIQANSVLQQKSLKKQKDECDRLHTVVVKDMLDTSRKMQAYAAIKNDNALLKDTKFTETELSQMFDVVMEKNVTFLHGIVEANLDEVAAYGLNADTQAKLLSDLALYTDSNPVLDNDKRGKKNVTSELTDNYKTADDIVSKFDKLVEIVRDTEAKFYADYKVTRKISIATETVQLIAQIDDAETGTGIPNATITITAADDSSAPIVKQTAAKGGFQLKTLDIGVYTVTAVKIGYTTQTLSITINGDAPYSLSIKLIKA